MRLFLIALIWSLATPARALSYNVSIDDAYGDERTQAVPTYSPIWTARSLTKDPCNTNCSSYRHALFIHNSTWHEWFTNVDDPPATISINFIGTRIHVFCILPNEQEDPSTGTTRLSFFMDGSAQPAGKFLHTFDPALKKYLFNQLVFSSDELPHGNHTLELRSLSDGQTGSLAAFDYALYTTDEGPAPETSPSPSTGPSETTRASSHQRLQVLIIGTIMCAAVGLLLAAVILWKYCMTGCNRRRASAPLPETGVHPFIGHLHRGVTVWRVGRGSQDALAKGLPLFENKRARRTSAQLRTEMQQMREELERVRRIAEPPVYAHNGAA